MSNDIRDVVIQELVLTEKRYIDELRRLKKFYESGYTSIDKEFSLFFQNLNNVITCNVSILKSLERYIDHSLDLNLGSVFLTFEPLLTSYKQYCVDYRKFQKLDAKYRENKKHRDVITVSSIY